MATAKAGTKIPEIRDVRNTQDAGDQDLHEMLQAMTTNVDGYVVRERC